MRGNSLWYGLWVGVLLVALSACGKVKDGSLPMSGAKEIVSGHSVPERPPESLLASQDFGELRVRPGNFASVVPGSRMPWSAWWYPIKKHELWKKSDGLSPLEKYDRYVQKVKGLPGGAADEENAFETPRTDRSSDTVSWEGHCDDWARAAIMAPEPKLKRPVDLDGIQFTMGDLKALLIKAHEIVPGDRQYGIRNNGDSSPDDIYPDQFHLVLQKVLLEGKRPFVMDWDFKLEVWNYPVYAGETLIELDAEDSFTAHVKTWVVMAKPLDEDFNTGKVNYDYLGDTLQLRQTYTYDLYGIPQSDGTFLVTHGVWTGRSKTHQHPDFLWTLPEPGSPHESSNRHLDARIVDEIVQRAVTAAGQ